MNGVKIQYGNFNLNAKYNVEISSVNDKFGTLDQLKEYNLLIPNYANPCQQYSCILDGTAKLLPQNVGTVGFWSNVISGIDGSFSSPISIEFSSNTPLFMPGLTLNFDVDNNIYATNINLKWYLGDDLVEDINVSPNSAEFVLEQEIADFDRFVITVYSINMPYNSLKIENIEFGFGTLFDPNSIRNAKLSQSINVLSTEIKINTVDFVLDLANKKEPHFQKNQSISVYYRDLLRSKVFIRSFKRQSKTVWNVRCEDYIGIMEDTDFYGGMYFNASAFDIASKIFSVANIPYAIDDTFKEIYLTGYIPFTTARNALMQVAFASSAVISTINSDVVKMMLLSDEDEKKISLDKVKKQIINEIESDAGVEITVHSYKPINNSINVYDASESGVGNNIFIKFNEPLHDLSITNGVINQFGDNYAVIDAGEGCLLIGLTYEHTTNVRRMTDGSTSKIMQIKDATLVSNTNVDKLLLKCYNYVKETQEIKCDIIEGITVERGTSAKYGQYKYGTIKYGHYTEDIIIPDTPVNVGDMIETETEYLGNLKKRVISQTFDLNGGILVKQSNLK